MLDAQVMVKSVDITVRNLEIIFLIFGQHSKEQLSCLWGMRLNRAL